MNHKITRYLVLFAISILFSACQTSKFKDCKSLSINSSSEAIPFYKDKKISPDAIGGYISSEASVTYADGGCKESQKVRILNNSSLKGSDVWLNQKYLTCKE